MRALAVSLLLLAGLLMGCGDDRQQYDAVCVDPVSHIRVDDWHCQQSDASWFAWWYILHSAIQPRIGYVAVYGSLSRPRRASLHFGGVPAAGRYVRPPAPRPPNAPQLNMPRPRPPARPAPIRIRPF